MAPLSPMIMGGGPATVPNGWGAGGLPLCYAPVQPGISNEDAPWGVRVRRPCRNPIARQRHLPPARCREIRFCLTETPRMEESG
jgi:hypothetical protein